jgi:3'-phosphoadenosine 5'-phosphosulfate sulfotransferase (PAPS reductase)/FAD synthetase
MSRFGRIVAEKTDPEAYRVHARTRAFARKVEQARAAVRKMAAQGSFAVSCSFGKDSIAVASLVLDEVEKPHIIHMDSPYKLPGWEHVRDYFAARAQLHMIPSKKTLEETIEWLKDVGLGYERETQYATRVTHRAKADAATLWCKEHGIGGQVLGLRAEESVDRRRVLRKRGLVYRVVSGQWHACPIGWWSVTDVWALIFSRDLPYPRLYDCESHGYNRETIRNTGWLTTIDAPDGRIAWLRHWFPEYYVRLVAEFPRLSQLR